MKTSIKFAALSLAITVLAGPVLGIQAAQATPEVLFFDDFSNGIEFKDQDPDALWFRYGDGDDPKIAQYKTNSQGLRLIIKKKSTDTNYSNANIATSEINNGASPFLRFGVNTRVETRMKFDANMQAPAANPGSARGSAGLLYWNYFTTPITPELGTNGIPQDAFGFSWQDSQSSLPGFKALAVVGGQFGLIQPLDGVNISEYNTYALERTHTSIKYFINGDQVAEVAVNQTGTLQIPDDHVLAADLWTDNASYLFEISGGEIFAHLLFNKVPANQEVNVSYVKITSLE